MKKLHFVVGAAVRNYGYERKVPMKQHPLTLQSATSFGCVACNFTGVVNNPIDPDRLIPCGCVNYREPDLTPVPTLTEALQGKKQQFAAKERDPVVEAMSQSLTAHLQKRHENARYRD